MQVTKEYLESSKSDIQYRARFWQVLEDTVNVNMTAELGGDVAAFGAGAKANKIADYYMQQMLETEISLNSSEKLNEAIFRQEGARLGCDPETVRGTGLAREYVPDSMQNDFV